MISPLSNFIIILFFFLPIIEFFSFLLSSINIPNLLFYYIFLVFNSIILHSQNNLIISLNFLFALSFIFEFQVFTFQFLLCTFMKAITNIFLTINYQFKVIIFSMFAIIFYILIQFAHEIHLITIMLTQSSRINLNMHNFFITYQIIISICYIVF